MIAFLLDSLKKFAENSRIPNSYTSVAENFAGFTLVKKAFVSKISNIPSMKTTRCWKIIGDLLAELFVPLFAMDRLLSTVFALNTSLTKKVVISIEYDNNVQNFIPKIRLIGRDFVGLQLNEETWTDFKRVLEEVTMFFCSHNQKILGKRITIGNLCLNLTTSHSDRALEIYENTDEVDDSRGQKKKYVQNIVYKFNTFTNLKKLIKCIDCKFAELKKITNQLDGLLNELVKKLYANIQHPKDSQYLMMTAQVIETSDIRINDEEILRIKNNLGTECDLSCAEISTILYQFLCIKPDYIAYKYNILFDVSRQNPF